MGLRSHTNIKANPLRGGAITVREPSLLPMGAFPMVQNVRPKRPGFIKRPGSAAHNSSADGTNNVETLYQFIKGRVTESRFFAQMDDGDILEITPSPPSTTGTLTEEWSGTSSQLPATWAQNDDLLVMANGVDMPQTFGGDYSLVKKFVKFDGTAAPPDFPEEGFDYTVDVQTVGVTEYADVSSLDTYANFECFYIMTPVPVNSMYIYVDPANYNDNASVMSVYYRKSDNTWNSVGNLSDGTADSGDTLAQSGYVTWDAVSDEIDHYQYGMDGYWYQFRVSAQLGSSTHIFKAIYQASFQDFANLWDGVPVDAIEAMVENDDFGYETYGSGAVDLDTLTSGNKIYFASTDPIEAVYIDVGSTPNASGTSLTSLKYWDGNSWTSVGTVTDGTSGMLNTGWMTFPRQSDVEPLHFESTQYYAYWYEMIWDSALAADMIISIQVRPYFDTADFGEAGYSTRTYHDRMTYSFDKFGEYLYISASALPQVLNGEDYGIIEMGDGRANHIRVSHNFYNNLLVWQEEKGVEGGCTTLLQGYDPQTYGKLVLSSRIGIMNAKSAVVVEDVATSAKEPEKVKTVAFWISRYGVIATDGRSLAVISDEIQNYFDPNDSNSIRRGYEDKHWIGYDSLYGILRIGLVTGTSATECNTFLVFDLADKVWYFDTFNASAYVPTCFAEVEGSTGDHLVYQMVGDTDGTIWRTNTGTADGSYAIETYVDIVFPAGGLRMVLAEMIIQCKVQSAGNITLTAYDNENSRATKTLSMTAERTNETVRTHRFHMNVRSRLLAIRLAHSTVSQDMYLENLGVKLLEWEGG